MAARAGLQSRLYGDPAGIRYSLGPPRSLAGAGGRAGVAGPRLRGPQRGDAFRGGRYYFESLDGWSIMPWVLGVTWFFFGRAVALWSLPSVIFLAFMVRIPFRAELALSLQLQLISTKLGCWGLQLLGQPATVARGI